MTPKEEQEDLVLQAFSILHKLILENFYFFPFECVVCVWFSWYNMWYKNVFKINQEELCLLKI